MFFVLPQAEKSTRKHVFFWQEQCKNDRGYVAMWHTESRDILESYIYIYIYIYRFVRLGEALSLIPPKVQLYCQVGLSKNKVPITSPGQ